MYPVTDAHMIDIFELQIDDLVGKSISHKATSKNGTKEIEMFTNMLSEMQNSLKNETSKLIKTFSTYCTRKGEQLERSTDGALTAVQTLASTAMCGIIHSVVGGHPLLILGVAEPTVIIRKARSWRYGSGWIGSLIADYGVPLMVLVWTAISYIPSGSVPKGIPR
ncbi:hypothetical protein AG4045_004559 [Apium graveolens]|uniref:Bicarbonate transporter-like transmembrane domain-containing protein n=1 Tax=Apium graveolens TaxID=4045 RepID=A0A6L5B8Q7_APIGR|nr:hypothetical protein AG4045_004559 [Apium graveolens]